ncbi:uncharacterized protein LOC141905459 isoform X2 [Tubulanus polymorphus]|uniref:uncharacterized protein LOC141905459 isoform X2 n=1 Tax=Tubulanus polymorphus TaxID=672921 RepID=UPI003DA26E94
MKNKTVAVLIVIVILAVCNVVLSASIPKNPADTADDRDSDLRPPVEPQKNVGKNTTGTKSSPSSSATITASMASKEVSTTNKARTGTTTAVLTTAPTQSQDKSNTAASTTWPSPTTASPKSKVQDDKSTKLKGEDASGSEKVKPDDTGKSPDVKKQNKEPASKSGVNDGATRNEKVLKTSKSDLLTSAQDKWKACRGSVWISENLRTETNYGPLKRCAGQFSEDDKFVQSLCANVVKTSVEMCQNENGLRSDFLEPKVAELYTSTENIDGKFDLCSKIKILTDASVTDAFGDFPEFSTALRKEETCKKVCMSETKKDNYGVCSFAYILIKALEDHSSGYKHMVANTVDGVLVDEGHTDTDIKKPLLSKAIEKYEKEKCKFPSKDMYTLLESCKGSQTSDMISDNCVSVLDVALAVCTGKAKGKDSIFLTKDVANAYLYNYGGEFDVCEALLKNKETVSHSFHVDGLENIWWAEVMTVNGCRKFCKATNKNGGGSKNRPQCVVMYLLSRAISDGTVGYVFKNPPNEGQIGPKPAGTSTTTVNAKSTAKAKSTAVSRKGIKTGQNLVSQVLNGDLVPSSDKIVKSKNSMLWTASRDWNQARCSFPAVDIRGPEGPLRDCDITRKSGVIPEMCFSLIDFSKDICKSDIPGKNSVYVRAAVVKAYLDEPAEKMNICRMTKQHLDVYVQKNFKDVFSFWGDLMNEKSCKVTCMTGKSDEKPYNNPVCVLFYLLLKGIQDAQEGYNATKHFSDNGADKQSSSNVKQGNKDGDKKLESATGKDDAENIGSRSKLLIKEKETSEDDKKMVPIEKTAGSEDNKKTEVNQKKVNQKTISNAKNTKTVGIGDEVDSGAEKKPDVNIDDKMTEILDEGKDVKMSSIERTKTTQTVTATTTTIGKTMKTSPKAKPFLPRKKPVFTRPKAKDRATPKYTYGEYENEEDRDQMLRPEERNGKPKDLGESEWSPSNSKPVRTKYKGPDITPSGHFMAYFVTAVILCILCYVTFHNKKKILAFMIEGRQAAGMRRRANNGSSSSKTEYKLLDQKSDALPHSDLDTAASAKNYIY